MRSVSGASAKPSVQPELGRAPPFGQTNQLRVFAALAAAKTGLD
jgi:hypothetical protein